MAPLFALLALQSAPVDPLKDPLLAKPITVHLALAPLRTVVATLGKAAGKTLDVSMVVSDWKATVLVKELPAGRTMEALADALGLVWQSEGQGYRLVRPSGSASAESAYVAAERTAQEKTSSDQEVTTVTTNGGAVLMRGRGARRDVAEPGVPRSYSRFDPDLLAIEVGGGTPPSRLNPTMPKGDSAFAKAALAWPSIPQNPGDAWRRPVGATPLGKSTWESDAYSMADLLVAFHDASGLPVVADAFRVPTRIRSMSPGTAIGVLQGIAGADGFSLRLADGVARLRHPAFWRLRTQEVPESNWRGLEGNGTPTLDDLASFATGLNASQAAAFRSQEAPLSHVRTAAVRDAYPALLLWSNLPDAARTALRAGRPVGLAQVRGASDAYAFALREAPYYHAGDPSRMLSMSPAAVGIFGAARERSVELRLAGERGGGVTYVIPL